MPPTEEQPSSLLEGMEIRNWSRMSAELMFIYDDEIDAQYLWHRQHLDDYAAILIREGRCTIEGEEGRVEALAGEWVLPRGRNRFQVFTPGSRILSIHFLLSWPGGMPVYDWNSTLVIPSAEVPELEERGKRLETVIANETPGGGRRLRHSRSSLFGYLHIYRHFYQWLETFGQVLASRGVGPIPQGKIDPRLLKVVQLLDRHPFHVPLSQAELAAQVNLSTNQLTRLFKGQFRMTPAAYFDQRRGREAFTRVQSSRDAFKEIAYDLGFSSPSHFSTWFAKCFRHSPSEIRGY
ncbi:MAG TPA: AraC family transcriptional regulator [Chthoniobacteraceae bacterium]|nr:AraC family transcriptional regulator [Chthoniobacteraceae bacterium]